MGPERTRPFRGRSFGLFTRRPRLKRKNLQRRGSFTRAFRRGHPARRRSPQREFELRQPGRRGSDGRGSALQRFARGQPRGARRSMARIYATQPDSTCRRRCRFRPLSDRSTSRRPRNSPRQKKRAIFRSLIGANNTRSRTDRRCIKVRGPGRCLKPGSATSFSGTVKPLPRFGSSNNTNNTRNGPIWSPSRVLKESPRVGSGHTSKRVGLISGFRLAANTKREATTHRIFVEILDQKMIAFTSNPLCFSWARSAGLKRAPVFGPCRVLLIWIYDTLIPNKALKCQTNGV